MKFIVKTSTKVGGNQVRRDLIDRAVEDLRQLEANKSLLLIDEPLSSLDYRKIFLLCDIICIPYLRDYYVNNSSGVMAEAIADAKPVVVTADTWLEMEARRFGAGIVTAQGTVEGYARALIEAVSDYENLARSSKDAAIRFVRYHNAGNLLAEVLVSS